MLAFFFEGSFMPNRYICSVLDEMRECLKTNNFSYLGGLIEEAQTLANRMEAKLHTINDFEYFEKRLKKLKAEARALEKDDD